MSRHSGQSESVPRVTHISGIVVLRPSETASNILLPDTLCLRVLTDLITATTDMIALGFELKRTFERSTTIHCRFGLITLTRRKSTWDLLITAEVFFSNQDPSGDSLSDITLFPGYTLASSSCSDLGCPFIGPSLPGPCTNYAGVLSLAEIESYIRYVNILQFWNTSLRNFIWRSSLRGVVGSTSGRAGADQQARSI